MNSSERHYRQGIWCIVIREMPCFFYCLEPGLGTYLCQETLYRSESCRRLRRTAPFGASRDGHSSSSTDTTCIPLSPAGPPGSCPLHLLHLCNLIFMIGMPNVYSSCGQTNALYATSLVCLGAKAKLRRRKPIVYLLFKNFLEHVDSNLNCL